MTFYVFSGANWQSIRTTDPIESTIAMMHLLMAKTCGCVGRYEILSLTFLFGQSAAKRWRRFLGTNWL